MALQVTAAVMGMPVSLRIVDHCASASASDGEAVFTYLRHIDAVFSTYKSESETERINRGELLEGEASEEMQTIIALCQQTKAETGGHFDANFRGRFDPSGLVKGYAIQRAAELLQGRGFLNFYVEAGGDIQTFGHNHLGEKWRVGIRNPFKPSELASVVHLSGEGIATSGTYERGEHIYNPIEGRSANEVASVSIIASNIYDADRFATAAFAMGKAGIRFIRSLYGIEGCVIGLDGRTHCTNGFQRYLSP